MGSRLMHLVIASEVAKRVNIQDNNAFLLGAIMPDATVDKKLTHYFSGDIKTFDRHCDYEQFLVDNSDSEVGLDFILGYYTHLISDDLWISGFYTLWLKNAIENNDIVKREHYSDFEKFNSYLSLNYDALKSIISKLDVDESLNFNSILASDAEILVNELKSDVQLNNENLDLKVFSIEQLVGYMKVCIDKSVYLINSVVKLR